MARDEAEAAADFCSIKKGRNDMRDITMDEALCTSGGLIMVPGAHGYEKCVAGFTLGGALFGGAIGVGTTWGLGGAAGFGIGATLGGAAGAYFCE